MSVCTTDGYRAVKADSNVLVLHGAARALLGSGGCGCFPEELWVGPSAVGPRE